MQLPLSDASRDRALTASAQLLDEIKRPIITYKAWQDEVWDFWDNLGEFNFGVTWLSNAVSRVRLKAGKITNESTEPELVEDGDVADIIASLAANIGGQSALLKAATIHLSVPGECWLVMYDDKLGDRTCAIRSADDIRERQQRRRDTPRSYQIRIGENDWETLPSASLVGRMWDPHPRHSYLATSPARAARAIMREIDFYNKHIIAALLSRLAFNGLLLIPDEITLPSRPEFDGGDVDGFIEMLVETASTSIANPGTASAAIPIPLKIPADFIDKITHLVLANGVDEQIVDKRDRAIKRLAATLNMPQEVILGMADTNHWTAWQLEESAIKIHIAPIVELICHALTKVYLQPMMKGNGVEVAEGERWVIWYDASELTAKPDLSANALEANTKGLISDAATRRELGFDEDDAPSDEELTDILLRNMLPIGTAEAKVAMDIIAKIGADPGIEIEEPEPVVVGPDGQPVDPGDPAAGPADQVKGPPNPVQPPEVNTSTFHAMMEGAR